MSWHSLETWLFEMPLSPIACTRSSTRRVETPPIQASWTPPPAPSAILRGSRKGGVNRRGIGTPIGIRLGPLFAYRGKPGWDSVSTAVFEGPTLIAGFDDVAVM